MKIEDHIAAVDSSGGALSAAARAAGLEATISTCPDWRVQDLLRHIGMVHRWAGTIVGQALTTPPDIEAEILAAAPAGESLFDWYDEGHAALVKTLTDAPNDLDCWYFMRNESALGFWARRQAHETTMHAIDAHTAAGQHLALDPALAGDGIDELLTCFLPRRSSKLRCDPASAVTFRAHDAGMSWRVLATDGPPTVARDDQAPVDATVTGTAIDLYLSLWNRQPLSRLDVAGSSPVLEQWSRQVTVTWS